MIKNGLIPLDKSWIIRMGILDLINGYSDTVLFLEKQKQLSDDLQALLGALRDWGLKKEINVGESGTLYRFLQFASWKLGLSKKFILQKTLRQRKICDNPEIINFSLSELLKLDNGTSQWASAAVLLGNKNKISNPPYKLALTYEAVSHWENQRKQNKCWIPRYDRTILKQAAAFLKILDGEKADFAPEQAEDYCFARAFGFITKEKGEELWPSLRSHESDRIAEMENVLANLNGEIESRDHRAAQAIAMLQKTKGKEIKMKYPEAVNKSWPQFWNFLKRGIII